MGTTPLNILLIDADAAESRLIGEALTLKGAAPHALHHVKRLAEGLKYLERKLPDVVLLELNLPDSAGMATLTTLTRHCPIVPVIVLASDESDDTTVMTLRGGAQDYLSKRHLEPKPLWRVIRNAIERKRLEESVRKSQERFELIAQGANDGLWDWSLETQQVYFSPRWKEMFGYTDREIGNDFKEWESRIHPEDLERSLREVRAYLKGGRAQLHLEHRMRHKDGSYRWILVRGVALRYSDGRPYRIAGTHMDITDLKRIQENMQKTLEQLALEHERLKATQNQLIQAEKLNSIGRIAAGIAHEIKNPLATISMGVQFMNSGQSEKDENTMMVLTEMADAIERADRIARGLLDYSAPLSIKMEPEDLNAVIEKALLLARHEIAKAHIHVEVELDRNLPKVDLDRNKIIQVLLNLIINAIHAMGDGGRLAIRTYGTTAGALHNADGSSTTRLEEMKRAEVVILELDDNGPGITPENLKKLFDPFFTTKPAGKGTGLGLAVCKSIVELHGASIQLANRPEGGARATLQFLL